jgi:KTSC domain-containing protein
MKVDSSYIRSINYDSTSHMMTVIFRDGCIVRYTSIHPRTYQAVINADSVGTKFTELVKDHKFVVIKAAT